MIPPAGGDVKWLACITLHRSRSRLAAGDEDMGGFGQGGKGEGYAER